MQIFSLNMHVEVLLENINQQISCSFNCDNTSPRQINWCWHLSVTSSVSSLQFTVGTIYLANQYSFFVDLFYTYLIIFLSRQPLIYIFQVLVYAGSILYKTYIPQSTNVRLRSCWTLFRRLWDGIRKSAMGSVRKHYFFFMFNQSYRKFSSKFNAASLRQFVSAAIVGSNSTVTLHEIVKAILVWDVYVAS